MKLAAICPTYKRPHLLGQLIEAFQRQSYPLEKRQLIILADDGLYQNQSGPGWHLISVPRRFATLGEKRNAAVALADHDVDGYLVADDDDIYLPHWFTTQAEALAQGDFSRPSLVLLEDGDRRMREVRTSGLFHGGWAFRREAFQKVGGYRAFLSNGEDQELAERLVVSGAKVVDPSTMAPPYYFYRDTSGSYHLSWCGDGHSGYRGLGNQAAPKASLSIGWPAEFGEWPVRRFHPPVAPHIAPASGAYKVELIGPQLQGGRAGPEQGMFALQRALKARIAHGLDWLTIKAKPPTPGCLAWWWNWQDRVDFARWDQAGHPSVIGPNVIFEHSRSPGGDPEERRVLNGRYIRAFFCHSPWYADLIRQHRTGGAPVFEWCYPIDPWPGEPEPDKYDLLIYAKNGWRPALLEHLERAYPRHRTIHYGQYERAQLFEAARQSRACAYLADDDHGPLALQEILLAGCPAIGVRTGASLITEGVSGLWVPRLCPGEQCVSNDQERADLKVYLATLQRLLEFDRQAVRAEAARRFDTRTIVDTLVGHLEQIRRVERDRSEVDQQRRAADA